LGQILQEAVSANTRCSAVCSLYIQFYKYCYLTTNPSIYQTDLPSSTSNGQTVQHFPINDGFPSSKWETTVRQWAFKLTVFWPQQEPGVLSHMLKVKLPF
jgi:hypothetical protein